MTTTSVTPLFDVLTVLLLAGLVSFGLSRHSSSVSVPPASAELALVTPVLLELSDDGGYRVNGQLIPGPSLADFLASVFRTRPAKVLFIKTGSTRTDQEFHAAVMMARGAGVVTVAVVGRP